MSPSKARTSRDRHQSPKGAHGGEPGHPPARPLSSLAPGTTGRIVRVTRDLMGRAERLGALGVSAGAAVRVLQTFPGIVFECDQTELAVERAVARSILVRVDDAVPAVPRPDTIAKDTQDTKPRNLSCVSLFRLMFRGSCREGI